MTPSSPGGHQHAPLRQEMSHCTVHLGSLAVSRLIIGGNPFSGFSHQSRERSAAMAAWYTDERIVETWFQAEALGLTACICRGDAHMVGALERYWRQGGKLRWIAQTDSAKGPVEGARYCLEHGASACFLHGGRSDYSIAQSEYAQIESFARTVADAGVPAGIAGHVPAVFAWAEAHLALDFYMVSYYNPSPRDRAPQYDPETVEQYLESDRAERAAMIQTLSRPAIHYKVLAAGRNEPAQALRFVANHMRPSDAVCVGIYTQDKPDMLVEDLALFLSALRDVGPHGRTTDG